jgi:hypothetical protein
VRVVASAGAGFLLAVLWFDLMFDVQVVGQRGAELPAGVRDSIATYYARVTTAARPMNRLVAATMLVTVGALIAETARGDLAAWRTWPSLVLAITAVGLAAGRTVRNAVRLGTQADDAAQQSRIARRVLCDHLVCIVAIAGVLVLQLLPA